MRLFRLLTLLLVLTLALPLAAPLGAHPVAAQDAPEVVILPINQAQFLPGVYFDLRIEVHAEALPEDFAVTINDEDAAAFFGADAVEETWNAGADDSPAPVVAWTWRDVMFSEPGAVTVAVVAGGETTSVTYTVREAITDGTAKNVILFIADGGNTALYTATRLVSRGMEQGTYNGSLSFDNFEEIGLLHTSGVDSIITDSANSISAYNTGHKSSVNANGVYADSSPDKLDDPRVEKFAYVAKRVRGMSVGIVTTSDFTDATPNGVWGYGRDRSGASRAAYAAQILDDGLVPEVLLGGGASYLLPQSAEGSRRQDDRDLFTEYEDAGYTIVTTATELDAALADGTPDHLAGFFTPSDMSVWLDRNVYTDNLGQFTDQPGLVDMTMAALDVLNQNPNGFYLEVEAASVDKAEHPMDWDRAIADAIEFDRAIAATVEWVQANAPDTLIIVTSDHGHGYDVYGTVDVEAFNAASDDAGRREAIGVYQNAGFPTYVDENGDFFPDSWDVSVTLAQGKVDHPDFTEDFQVSPVYRAPAICDDQGVCVDNPTDDENGITMSGNLPAGESTSVHTLQDVPVYATGPGAAYFGHVLDNTDVFFGMAAALGLDPMTAAE
ncbi:MAG TPA: alkaline phosphatase [Aggregatilinea sp.]|uniref:alkaline phosphatase n=1 Tax=Aggregatilinea sp. TaxID=2806333 RepID=UPI002B8C8BBE|nr:alkaline phosphatase [Aggregatilinea sp.]HML23387.1 alkaline phosphatase [Aggregatilinea sp.]